jgi:hypothetical protein
MSAVIVVHADALFCDSTHDIPNCEPDAHAMRWYRNLAEGSSEQLVVSCDSPNVGVVDRWLRNFDLKYSYVLYLEGTDARQRMERLVKNIALQQAKIVLFIGGRFIDCNHMGDLGVPSLRYLPPNSAAAWETDQRTTWERVVAKQGGE